MFGQGCRDEGEGAKMRARVGEWVKEWSVGENTMLACKRKRIICICIRACT